MVEQIDKKTHLGIAKFEKNVPREKEMKTRKHPRFLLNLPIEYYHLDSLISYSSHTINASEGGLMIGLRERLKVGQHLNLKIFYSFGMNLLTLETTVRVIWAEEFLGKEGDCRHGVEFVSLSQEDLQQFKKFLDSLSPFTEVK